MTDDLLTRDARTIADIERIRFFPATTVGGEGSYVIEEGGRRVLDFSASWGAACLGYSHPALAEAVSEAVRNMGAVSLASCAVGHAVGLAEDLLARLPDDRDRRVWFGHAGSDANDAVVRLLEAATPRRGILSFVGAYHGGSAASMSVSGHSSQSHAPARDGLTRLVYPDPYRPQFTPDLVQGALDDLDRRFESELAAGRDRRRLHRADPVGRRPHRAARRLPQGAGGTLPRPRHPDRRGRGEGGDGAHRPVPCLRGRGPEPRTSWSTARGSAAGCRSRPWSARRS